jgi:hypothetical protein
MSATMPRLKRSRKPAAAFRVRFLSTPDSTRVVRRLPDVGESIIRARRWRLEQEALAKTLHQNSVRGIVNLGSQLRDSSHEERLTPLPRTPFPSGNHRLLGVVLSSLRLANDPRISAARRWLQAHHRDLKVPGFTGAAYQRWPRGLSFYYSAAASQAFRSLGSESWIKHRVRSKEDSTPRWLLGESGKLGERR